MMVGDINKMATERPFPLGGCKVNNKKSAYCMMVKPALRYHYMRRPAMIVMVVSA
jgi:hypothetical protein